MSATRWTKFENCGECRYRNHLGGGFCGLSSRRVSDRDCEVRPPKWCPLPRLGDIPEVKRLAEAVRRLFAAMKLELSESDYLGCFATEAEGGDEVNSAWIDLRAALAELEEGERT